VTHFLLSFGDKPDYAINLVIFACCVCIVVIFNASNNAHIYLYFSILNKHIRMISQILDPLLRAVIIVF
jgi:hypothetical protein